MLYLITQLLLLLAIASLLSGAIGWLCRRYFTEQQHQDQIRDHKRARGQQYSEIEDLRRELTDRNTQIAGLNSKLQFNQDSMQQAESQKASLLHDLDDLHRLENQLRAVEDDRDRIDHQLATAENDLSQAKRAQIENDKALQNALAEKEQRLLTAAATVADKEQQLKAALSTSAEKDNRLNNALEEKAQQDVALRDAAIAAAETEQKLKSAASTNANLEDIIASLKDDVKTKTEEREKANQQHALLIADLGRLESKLAQVEQKSENKINDLEKAFRAESDSHAAAKQAIAAGEQKLHSLNDLLAERTQERDKLEKLSEAQQREIAALNREIANAQKTLADTQIANQKQVADLEHELDKHKSAATQADRELDSAKQTKGQIQKELDSSQAQLNESKAQSAAQNIAANENLERQKLALADANSTIAALEQQIAALKQERNNLKAAADNNLGDLHRSEKEGATLAEKIAAADAKIADLQKQMSSKANDKSAAEQQLQRELDAQAATLSSRDSDLRDAVNKSLDLQNSLAEQQSKNAAQNALIEKLQNMLRDERRLAGQSLLSRIAELEAMLDAERRKADELPVVTEVGSVNFQSRSTVRTTAANSSTVSNTKTGTSR